MSQTKYSILGFIVLVLSYSVIYFVDKDTAIRLTHEDGFFENLGFLFFLFSSISFACSYKKHKNWIFIILAFLFFFAAGEEISWGQRFFHIKSEVIQHDNVQGEINIHNLEIFNRTDFSGKKKSFMGLLLNPDRLFNMFWLFWCLLIPLIHLFNPSLNDRLKKFHIQIPMVMISIGSIFLVNYLTSKILSFLMVKELNHPLVETKEWIAAFLFFLVSVELFKRKTDELY